MPKVELEPAGPERRETIANLIQLYTHDFSEFWDGAALAVDGRYPDYPLEPYFERPGWAPYLFRVDGVLAGFALINDQAHSGQPADRSVAEFFVVRNHRRHGLGQRAAERLFRAAPGVWETAVARRNTPAQAFWRRVTSACAAPGSHDELDLMGPDWNGPVFRFRIS